MTCQISYGNSASAQYSGVDRQSQACTQQETVNSMKPVTFIWCLPERSYITKFEDSKNDLRNAKNVWFAWLAIIHIFNEVWC